MSHLEPRPPSQASHQGLDPSSDPFDLVTPWSDASDGVDLRRYFLMLRRYWVLALTVLVLVVAAFFIRYKLTPPIYEATTTVRIELRPMTWTGSSNSLEMMIEDSWNTEFYPTQYELIKTMTLGQRVVRDLGLLDHPANG